MESLAPVVAENTPSSPENRTWGGETNKVLMSNADVQVSGENKLDAKEQQKLHALLGGGKKQQTHVLLGKKNEQVTLGESDVDSSHTLVIKDCEDSTFTINAMVTKLLVDGCQNCKLVLNTKIITSMVEAYRCNNFHVESNVKIGTLQADMCSKFSAQFPSKDLFTQLIWAGVHDLSLDFADAPDQQLRTGYNEMKALYPDLHEERGQFIVRFVKDRLLSERIIRLENGFPTTEREKKEFDDRQEENMRKLAEQAGIKIGRKKTEKIKPNETCPKCNSGKKYKKCCGKNL